MAVWKPNKLAIKGALATFHETLANIPTVWKNHCLMTDSTTSVEQYVFPGFLPTPRMFLNGRTIQGLRDFKFNVANQEFELSILIDRKSFEDEQYGLITSRLQELAEVWGTFKDYLFSQLLVNGDASGNNGWDGVTFFSTTRTIGGSANIDNALTSGAAVGTIPSIAEFRASLELAKSTMRRYTDDQGRPFNTLAVSDLRVVIPPTYESIAYEALNAQIITGKGASDSEAGSKQNTFKSFAQPDVLDYLTEDDYMYITAVGASRKPFIHQQRVPLEVVMLDDEDNVTLHNGVLVLCRERFVMTYGEPRRAIQYKFT